MVTAGPSKVIYRRIGNPVAFTEVTRYQFDALNRVVREERIVPVLAPSDSASMLVKQLTFDSLGRVSERVLRKERGGNVVEVQDDSTYAYQPQLDAVRLVSASNAIANLSFSSEATPPFATTAYQMQAVDPANPWGLIQDPFTVTPAQTPSDYNRLEWSGFRIRCLKSKSSLPRKAGHPPPPSALSSAACAGKSY